MVKIENVIPNSTAAKAGLNSKDKIITINGQEINDYIDYLYQISEPIISLKLKIPLKAGFFVCSDKFYLSVVTLLMSSSFTNFSWNL